MSSDRLEIHETGQKDRTSVFEDRTIDDIHQEIQETYLADDRPWVIGYSGGKDSTATLQLIWYAIKELPEEKRTKTVYVISSDTLVETPKIVNHITSTLDNVNEFAEKENLPFEAHKVTPQVDDTFWVNLIGRGYPAPNQTFRWCTERMKIDPADRFIEERVNVRRNPLGTESSRSSANSWNPLSNIRISSSSGNSILYSDSRSSIYP